MTLYRIVRALYRWWWLVVATVLVAGMSSYLGTRALPRMFTSRATLVVGQVLQSPNPSAADISTGQMLAKSYADLARREPVLRASLEALGLDWDWTTLRSLVSSRAIPNTTLVELVVKDTDPERARVFVNEITNQLILQSPTGTNPQKEVERQFVLGQMRDLQAGIQKGQQQIRDLDNVIAKATSARQIEDTRSQQMAIQAQISTWQATYARLGVVLQEGAPNSLGVIEMAQAPQPVDSPTLLNVVVAALVGLVLSSGVGLVLEFVDDSLKTADDVRRVLNLASLGSIPRIKRSDGSSPLVMVTDPRSPTAEAFRMLRTNLLTDPSIRSGRTLLLTSCSPGEGKSLIAANLAACFAQSGKYVILVDADLRRPTLHQVFQLKNEAGLSSVLKNQVRLEDALQTAPIDNLWVLTSGPLPDDPGELLESKRMLELIESLEQHAHIVIFDSPPVMAVGDATVLGPRLDSTLLVVDSGSTRQPSARHSQDALKAAKAHLSGAILNRILVRDGGYSYDYYGEDGKRSRQRTRRESPQTKLGVPAVARPIPNVPPRQLSGVPLSMAVVKEVERPFSGALPGPRRTVPSPEIKPSPASTRSHTVKAPMVQRVVRTATVGHQAGAPSMAPRVPVTRPSIIASGLRRRDLVAGYIAGHRRLALALVGVGLGAVLVAVFASSLFQRNALRGIQSPTATGVAAQATTSRVVSASAVDLTATVAAKETASAILKTEEAQARSAAATGTAEAGATATQSASNALAAQLALGLLSCDRIDFAILESPADVTSTTSGDATIAFTWRVRNRAVLSNCKWGSDGQETRLFRAAEVGGQLRTNVPVRLEWIGNDEYYLSLNTLLGKGKYDLRWRLLLPKTNLPGGPEFAAKVLVLAPTFTPSPTLVFPTAAPTFTPVPAATACPTTVFACHCRQVCSGRKCDTECDECTTSECK